LKALSRYLAAAPTMFGFAAVVTPPRIAEIERAGIGQRAYSRAAQTANKGAGARVPGERTNRRTSTCA